MSNILTVKNLSKKYDKSEFSLKNISFDVPKGAIIGIIGENGSGKSSTINCIMDIVRKDKGEITFSGKDLLKNPQDKEKKIGRAHV